MLGAAMVRGPEGYAVRWVSPDSPASEAGIEAGDVVKSIDGEPFAAVDPARLRERLRVAGQVLKLEVDHSGVRRDVTVTLRRLI